jgi:hypothetical protein
MRHVSAAPSFSGPPAGGTHSRPALPGSAEPMIRFNI